MKYSRFLYAVILTPRWAWCFYQTVLWQGFELKGFKTWIHSNNDRPSNTWETRNQPFSMLSRHTSICKSVHHYNYQSTFQVVKFILSLIHTQISTESKALQLQSCCNYMEFIYTNQLLKWHTQRIVPSLYE